MNSMHSAAKLPRWSFIRGVLLCSVLLPAFGCHGATSPQLLLQDGSTQSLADLRGRWVLVNYWAEWCAPCRHEIPELNALQRSRKDTLVAFGVNYDGIAGPELASLAKRMGIEFKQLRADPGPALGVTKPEVLPTTLLIDPDGHVQTLVGPQTGASLTAAMQRKPTH